MQTVGGDNNNTTTTYDDLITLNRPWARLIFPNDIAFDDEQYEADNVDRLTKWLRPGMTVLDIGAHCGYYATLQASLVGKRGHVYAYEPNPKNIVLLKKNVRENNFGDIVTINEYGLGNTDEIRHFNCWHGTKATGRSQFIDGDVPEYQIDVQVHRLDTVWPADRKIDFIQMDVEHWEYAVILGAQETISKYKPDMLIEIHSTVNADQIRTWASSAGYIIEEMKARIPKCGHTGDYFYMEVA